MKRVTRSHKDANYENFQSISRNPRFERDFKSSESFESFALACKFGFRSFTVYFIGFLFICLIICVLQVQTIRWRAFDTFYSESLKRSSSKRSWFEVRGITRLLKDLDSYTCNSPTQAFHTWNRNLSQEISLKAIPASDDFSAVWKASPDLCPPAPTLSAKQLAFNDQPDRLSPPALFLKSIPWNSLQVAALGHWKALRGYRLFTFVFNLAQSCDRKWLLLFGEFARLCHASESWQTNDKQHRHAFYVRLRSAQRITTFKLQIHEIWFMRWP